MKAPSSILYQNDSKTVVLLDLPRSIEEAQFLPGACHDVKTTGREFRYLVSSPPPASPFPTPEPKNAAWGETQSAGSSPSAQIAELMTLAAAESALEDLKEAYDGPWYLPRHSSSLPVLENGDRSKALLGGDLAVADLSEYIIPENSHPVLGSIESQRENVLKTAPKFDLVVLDPPWPNRSAKRKRGSYQPVGDLESIRKILSLVPVASHLSPGGLVAVWVTNSYKSADLLTSRGGIFDEWQVDLVGEWMWLKVTSNGEPIVDLHSAWRKPWERLLIARRRGGQDKSEPVGRKVIVTAPDVHSRKPNLRYLFSGLLPEGFRALEVFARNLTAGWWCWGDQVLLFQHLDHWVEAGADTVTQEISEDSTI